MQKACRKVKQNGMKSSVNERRKTEGAKKSCGHKFL